MNDRSHLLEPASGHLEAWLDERGWPRYRAAQVRRWVFGGRARDFDAMSDVPRALRDELAKDFSLWTTRIVRHKLSDDGTEKLLLELSDAQTIECELERVHSGDAGKKHFSSRRGSRFRPAGLVVDVAEIVLMNGDEPDALAHL